MIKAAKESVCTDKLTGSTVFLLAALFISAGTTQADVLPDTAAPSFEATTLDGSSLSFPSDNEGRATIVLMWSTWCPYCKVLFPRVEKLRDEYGLQVIAINAKERGIGDPKQFMDEAGYQFTNVLAGDDIAAAYDVQYLPGLFVVDGDGQIVYRRGWTDLRPGQQIADLWEAQVREAISDLGAQH